MWKIVKKEKNAREALKRGVDTVADVVKRTLGPSGQNVIIGRKFQSPLITNDGFTIVKDIELEDEIENLGAGYIKEASRQTNTEAGDGTTTAIVLAQALYTQAFEELSNDVLGGKEMAYRRRIQDSLKGVLEELDSIAKPIIKAEEIRNVASISAESEELGQVISDVIQRVGKNGVVTTDDSEDSTTHFEVVDGIEIEQGMAFPSMMTDFARRRADYKNTPVLVTKVPVMNVETITPLIQTLAAQGKGGLVIVADGFEGNTIQSLIQLRMQGGFAVLCVGVPGFGNKGDDEIDDLSTVVGAKTLDKVDGLINIKDLGSADRVISTVDTTTFSGGGGKEVKARIKLLKEQKEGHDDPEWIERRIAQLAGGVGVIKVGADTPGEREYKKLKVEDAINATRAAIEEGVVPGGGLALKTIAEGLPDGDVLKEVIQAPYKQIQMNAGEKLTIPKNVVDPVKVTKEALRSACSVAGTLITTNGAIAEKREDPDKK